MDIFYEQFVTKDYEAEQKKFNSCKKALGILIIFNIIFNLMILTIFFVAFYVVLLIVERKKFLEFEYELTGKELVISKIINKKRRKIIGKVNLDDVLEIVCFEKFCRKDVKIINASLGKIKNEKILITKNDSGLIGYRMSIDSKLQRIFKSINPTIFR